MLHFESELSCIPASEPEVLAACRSIESVSFLPGEGTEIASEAYICQCGKESGSRTFLALHLRKINRALVFSVTSEQGDPVERAIEFAGALGFTMERLGLDYGRAMREVILRQVPVLLSVEVAEREKRKREAEIVDLRQKAAGQQPVEEAGEPTACSGEEEAERQQARQLRAAETREAARKLALEECHCDLADKVHTAVEECLLPLNAPAAIAAAQGECKRSEAAKNAAEARCGELEEKLVELTAVAAGAQESGRRIADLEAALAGKQEQIEAARRQMEERDSELTDRIAELQEALEAAEGRAEELEKEIREAGHRAEERIALLETGHAERVSGFEAELAAFREEVRGAQAECEDQQRARNLLEKRNADLEAKLKQADRDEEEQRQNESAHASRAAELEEKLRRISEETATERAALTARAEAAEGRLADLQESARRAARESTAGQDVSPAAEKIAELEQALEKAWEEIEAERFERELLVREKGLIEQQLADIAGDQRPEWGAEGKGGGTESAETDERRIASLSEALALAEAKVALQREELERMASAREKAAEEPAAPRSGGGSMIRRLAPISPGPLSTLKSSPTAEATAPPPHVVRRPPRRGAFFHVDWERTRIEYDHPDEILEVYQPPGMIQLSLEGYPNQHCSAYIVTCKKGKSRQVHIAFGLAESARTLIYSPAKALRNRSDYDKAFREAFKYLKVVGFNPEPVPLGSSTETRMKALENISVLRGPLGSAQGF